MSTYVIENEKIRLEVALVGAEIKSLIRKSDGKEMMWQADPEFWGRTSPILFPLVGNYFEKKTVFEGKTLEMGQHGFARDMEFKLVKEETDELLFELRDTEETRKNYPFSFILTVGYKLVGSKVVVSWVVENNNDRTMYFSIGGHPAFNCDLDTYTLRFEKNGKPNEFVISNVIADDGSCCMSDETKRYDLERGVLHMSDELFARDALVIENGQTDKLTLVGPDGKDELSVSLDVPLFGVWSPTMKHAPFVCIEPWCGRCDRVGYNKGLENREYGNTLNAGEKFSTSYDIEVL